MFRGYKFMVPVLLLFLSYTITAGQETRTVTAEGVAEIHQGALNIARDAAIEDAQQRAVEQAISIMIDSETHVRNYQAISEKILSRMKGYITHYDVIGENQESGLLRLRIRADISFRKLNEDLSAIGILMSRVQSTRPIAITIFGLNKIQFVKFKDVLRNQVSGIKGLHERSFTGTIAKISVDSESNSESLSQQIAARDFGTFGVEVIGSTASSLELKVTPK